jgi:carboxyl-terminal processing protease
MGNKKLQIWLPLLFSIIMIVGMYFGYQLREETGGGKGFFNTGKRNSLQEAIDLVRTRYVDSIRLDTLEDKAIKSLMNELDPHSVFIPASELQAVNEDLEGKFEGIGVEFNIFSDTVNIVYVIAGGPGDKAGLQIGDKILKVNDSILTGKNINSDYVKKQVRGIRGSKAVLQVYRDGQMLTLTATRDMIPVSSVDASYMVDKETGYIRLNRFSENTYVDFMRSLDELKKQGMQKLILDLRGNGGGLMKEATDIADEFLGDDRLIVYTEGINSPRENYKAKRPGIFEDGRLVVLVDELSASASEVLAGALQDWDRATIVGRRTFGKGLVQKQYPLSDGSAIRLTVARYYTPLGRSIQRPYNNGKKVYMDEIWQRYSNGEALYADSNKISNGKEYKTRSGKIVYGGGGIMPDIFVPMDTSTYQRNVSRALANGSFNNFVYNYYLQHKNELQQYKDAADYTLHFNRENEMWEQFVKYESKDTIDLSKVSARDKESVQKRLKAFLARFRWRTSGFYQVLNADDKMLAAAMDALKK